MAHTHDVYDMENHFEINGSSRFIKETSETKLVVVQGDHKSEVLTFKMPRYIDGHDMTLCNKIRIHYINLDTKTNNKSADVYEVTDLTLCEECEDVLTFTWTIEAPATKYSGTLSFLVKFECTEGENVLYQWNTAKYVSVNVLAGIDNSEEFVEKYSNVLEEWYNELTKGADSIEELNQQALAEIELAKEDAKEDIQGKANSTMDSLKKFVDAKMDEFSKDVDAKMDETLETSDGLIGERVEDWLDGSASKTKSVYYNSVSDMKSDEKLLAGTTCITLGYYAANDGGGAIYKTRNKATNDENKIECVVCSNVTAEIIVNEHDTVNVLQFGLKNDGSEDCSETFMKLVQSDRWYNIYFPSGSFAFYSPLKIYQGYPNHRIFGNMPHTRKNWDNYHMASHLLYYPQENDTTFISFGGDSVEMEKLYIQCMEYGKNTTGFLFEAIRGRISFIRILDFDNVSLYVTSPYSIIEYINCGASNDYISYVYEDLENRRNKAWCVFGNSSKNCNNVVTGLTCGAPDKGMTEKGLVIGGVGNKFVTLFLPANALVPITFQSTANSCTIENPYFEVCNEIGDVDLIVFEEGSKNNHVSNIYMSGSFSFKDYGFFNTVESSFSGLFEIGPRIYFEKLSNNLCDIEFTKRDDGTVDFVNTKTDNGFHSFGFYNDNSRPIDIDDDGYLIVDNTIRNNLTSRLNIDSFIGKYLDDDVYIVFGAYFKIVDADTIEAEITNPLYLNTASDKFAIPNFQFGRTSLDRTVCYGIAKLSKEYLEQYAHLNFAFFDTRGNQGTGTFKYKPFFYLLYRGMKPVELPQ